MLVAFVSRILSGSVDRSLAFNHSFAFWRSGFARKSRNMEQLKKYFLISTLRHYHIEGVFSQAFLYWQNSFILQCQVLEDFTLNDEKISKNESGPSTRIVDEEVFRQVYDSPASLPGKENWVTTDKDVRSIESLLGMKPNTIGAPLWVSGDTRYCKKCGRETNWLDIVSSGLSQTHKKEMIARVILGDKKFVNIEAPKAIADLYLLRLSHSYYRSEEL